MTTPKVFSKEICEWSEKDLRKHYLKLRDIVTNPQYVCMKCGRAANRKKWLCQVKKLDS